MTKLIPKFKANEKDRLYLTEKYIANGHYLVKRDSPNIDLKPIDKMQSMRLGFYQFGQLSDGLSKYDEKLDSHIPKRDGYALVKSAIPRAVVDFETYAITCYVFTGFNSDEEITKGKDATFEIGVNPDYVQLLLCGRIFVKSALAPILILNGPTLNDDLVAIVMPMRVG